MDQTYQVLKRANEIAGKPGGGCGGPVVRVSAAPAPEEPARSPAPARPTAGLAVAPQPVSSCSGWRSLHARVAARATVVSVVARLVGSSEWRRARAGAGARSVLSAACR